VVPDEHGGEAVDRRAVLFEEGLRRL